MKKKERKSVDETARSIINSFRFYLLCEMGMTDADIDEAINDFGLEDKICSDFEVYSYLNNEQLCDRVLGIN